MKAVFNQTCSIWEPAAALLESLANRHSKYIFGQNRRFCWFPPLFFFSYFISSLNVSKLPAWLDSSDKICLLVTLTFPNPPFQSLPPCPHFFTSSLTMDNTCKLFPRPIYLFSPLSSLLFFFPLAQSWEMMHTHKFPVYGRLYLPTVKSPKPPKSSLWRVSTKS